MELLLTGAVSFALGVYLSIAYLRSDQRRSIREGVEEKQIVMKAQHAAALRKAGEQIREKSGRNAEAIAVALENGATLIEELP